MNSLYKLFLLAFLYLYAPQINAQLQITPFVQGKYFLRDKSSSVSTGFEVNLWADIHVAFNYDLHLGYDTKYGFTVNTGFGPLLCGALLKVAGKDTSAAALGIATVAIISLFAPKGLTFAFNPDDMVIVMPYLNPLESRYLGATKETSYGGSIGLKVQFEFKNGMSIRPNLGLSFSYTKGRPAVIFGIDVAFGRRY